jgi:acetyl esterase
MNVLPVAFAIALFAASAAEAQTPHVYASPGGTDLKAYVFTPAGVQITDPRPAIVIFHGGGWAEGDAEWAFPRAQHFAERGMIAVAAQYRLSNGKGTTPVEAMADARAVIRWMRAEARSLGIDPTKIAAYGWSAGAHLAASAAVFEDAGASVSSRPDALVLSSPAVSIDADSWFQELLGDRGKARDYSPDEHVRAGMPPTVIVQGDVDTVTPLTGVTRFCDRMKAAGNTCELHVFKGFGHLFTPAGTRDDRQPAPDRAVAAEAMQKADRFLRALGYQR